MDDYTADVFRERAVAPEVAAERGYRRYGGDLGLDPIFEADARYADGPFKWPDGKPDTLRAWAGRQTKGGKLPGWVMAKHALPGSAFDAPLAQLRPDDPILKKTWPHSHADEPASTLSSHLASEKRKEEHAALAALGVDLSWELHRHRDEAKYLLPPGPHGKRWDTHPRCTPDRFRAAERVFLHLEGTLKLDALVSAGEVGADVPSVTLWDRHPGEMSELDFPASPTQPAGAFWDWYDEYAAEVEAVYELQAGDLHRFLDEHVRAPVIVVCDRDWRHNPQVALEAFSLRDVVRAAGLHCVVAAPPGKSKGSDDFQFHGGKPDNLGVVEPLPHKAPGRADFEREYRRAHGGASGRRRPSDTVDRELALLDWYATHATVEGFVKRPVRRIAARLGVSPATVKRATLKLARTGALQIEGHYHDPDEEREVVPDARTPRRHKPAPAAIRLRDDLVSTRWEPTVGRWLRSLE